MLPSSNTMPTRTRIAVIGGGPAGLRAAEVAAAAGMQVTLYDGMRSVGRKFLIAGKGGLNLTHGEDFGQFIGRYSGPDLPVADWHGILQDFDSKALRQWASDLGVETFEASSGRVYPKALKAAPLLRRWIARLKHAGVRFEMNHRWSGIQPGSPHTLSFENGRRVEAGAVILALGGASWPQTGSTGGWMKPLQSLGIACHLLEPANCGWECSWPQAVIAAAEGQPIKNIRASAAGQETVGELLLTRYGLEGGAIYQLGRALRGMERPAIAIDFKPAFSRDQLVAKMESVKRDFPGQAKIRWRLGAAAHAILACASWDNAEALATAAKHCVIELTGPRPIEEAISSAGGVCWSELDGNLMLKRCPGVFVAGEMIDWEAPTGGYLLTACLASGRWAGLAAERRLATA